MLHSVPVPNHFTAPPPLCQCPRVVLVFLTHPSPYSSYTLLILRNSSTIQTLGLEKTHYIVYTVVYYKLKIYIIYYPTNYCTIIVKYYGLVRYIGIRLCNLRPVSYAWFLPVRICGPWTVHYPYFPHCHFSWVWEKYRLHRSQSSLFSQEFVPCLMYSLYIYLVFPLNQSSVQHVTSGAHSLAGWHGARRAVLCIQVALAPLAFPEVKQVQPRSDLKGQAARDNCAC